MTNNASAVILPDVLNLSYTSNRWYGASRAAGTINLPGGVNYAYCRLLRFSEGAAYLSVIDAESKRQYVKMWNDVVGWGDYSELVLKDDLPGKIYWGGTETINITSTGQFATGTKKITIPAGTYIVMGHATIPEGINATGRIKLDINALYETQQSWYPSQYAIEVNITTFKYFSVQTDITLSVRADKLITGITTEVAAIRIN